MRYLCQHYFISLKQQDSKQFKVLDEFTEADLSWIGDMFF